MELGSSLTIPSNFFLFSDLILTIPPHLVCCTHTKGIVWPLLGDLCYNISAQSRNPRYKFLASIFFICPLCQYCRTDTTSQVLLAVNSDGLSPQQAIVLKGRRQIIVSQCGKSDQRDEFEDDGLVFGIDRSPKTVCVSVQSGYKHKRHRTNLYNG